MSSLKRNLFLSVFGAAMSASVAFAADLPTPPIIEYEPETLVEIGSSWYLRGDIGYAAYGQPKASWLQVNPNKHHQFHGEEIDNTFLVGAGFGYYFNHNLRADLTLDYRQDMKFKAKSACVSHCSISYTGEYNSFSAWTLMLNGYYDFGSWNSITPYVGAGVGLVYLKTDDHTSSNSKDRFNAGDKTNFAWNVMAGAAIDLEEGWKVDANYRFLSMGSVETAAKLNGNAIANPVKYEDLYAHEFRVGLRYDLH
ncbi:MAG: porin family protein [Cohaesibacter sp.]|nr:porin family protein [Cohaesibacter sp.]